MWNSQSVIQYKLLQIYTSNRSSHCKQHKLNFLKSSSAWSLPDEKHYLSGGKNSQWVSWQHSPSLVSGVRLRTYNLLAALPLHSPALQPHNTNLHPSPLCGISCRCPWCWHRNRSMSQLLKGSLWKLLWTDVLMLQRLNHKNHQAHTGRFCYSWQEELELKSTVAEWQNLWLSHLYVHVYFFSTSSKEIFQRLIRLRNKNTNRFTL